MQPDIKTIRAAVQKNRGGWEKMDDAAVLRLWNSLEPVHQTQYLESLQEKDEKSDDRTGSPSNV